MTSSSPLDRAGVLAEAEAAGRRARAAHARGEPVEPPGDPFNGPLLARQGVSAWYRGFTTAGDTAVIEQPAAAARAFDAAAHPRAPAGSSAGGQFAASSGSGKDTRATPSNAHPVGEGERGRRVSDLQARLNALGFKLKADGVFGPKTLAAVRAFQKARGLKVDGLVGPKTTAALRLKTPHGKPSAAPAAGKPAAAKPARAARALAHEPLGRPGGPGLFGVKGLQLPAFIQHIAKDLMQERGMPESEAIATAVSQCKKWAAGGEHVHPDTRAKAAAAVAEWERAKARAHATRSVSVSSGYDADGLDGSWDDLDGLPDLTGLGVADFEAVAGGPDTAASRAARLGTGARFQALKAKLAAKGAADPGGLAAFIGRRKFGKARFASLAGAARKHKGGGMSRSAGELMRIYPLEDIHILTRAEGDGSGRVVEAYATVFDQAAEIHDAQGHYEEVIDRTAFDEVLGRIMRSRGGLAAAVKVLFNHGRTAGGVEAPEFQLPLGKPLDVRPEARGLLTRTEYDASDPFTERVLSKIHAGTITAQSFVGGIIRSSPELRGPGDRYRARNGALTTVRRMVLGLREYGPVLYPAYSGAEILGVRMSIPGQVLDPELAELDGEDAAGDDLVEEDAPGMEDAAAGGIPEEMHPTRDHAHRLLVVRTQELCREAGIGPVRSNW